MCSKVCHLSHNGRSIFQNFNQGCAWHRNPILITEENTMLYRCLCMQCIMCNFAYGVKGAAVYCSVLYCAAVQVLHSQMNKTGRVMVTLNKSWEFPSGMDHVTTIHILHTASEIIFLFFTIWDDVLSSILYVI